jgi:dihydrofolate synthase/folylpolyglutamate synthase
MHDAFPGLAGKEIYLPLLGDFQLDNAETAITCLAFLQQIGNEISADDIIQGFKGLRWPGRFEIISRNPLVIIDGAHNYDSFRKLKATIDIYLSKRKKIFIFGVSEDKEVRKMLSIINPSIDLLIITQAKHPRALGIGSIEQCARKIGMEYTKADSVEDSLKSAMEEIQGQTAIIAAGSIFIAGEVRKLWPSFQERITL